MCIFSVCFFFFNDTATTEIYTLSLHDALPICGDRAVGRLDLPGGVRHGPAGRRGAARPDRGDPRCEGGPRTADVSAPDRDRKSTRLNSSHANISYAVFCLKKKQNTTIMPNTSL